MSAGVHLRRLSGGNFGGHETSAFEADDPIARGRKRRIVGDDDRRQAMFAMHVAQQPLQSGAGRFVQIARWLVGEKHGRLAHEGACDGDALLLAAGQRARPMVEPMLETDAAQQLLGTRLRLAVLAGRR